MNQQYPLADMAAGGAAQTAAAASPAYGGGGLHAALPALLAVLKNHPDLSGSMLSGIIGGFGSLVQQHQAQAAQNKQGLTSLLTGAFQTPGTTPDMIAALGQAAYPNLANSPFGQNAISSLATALPAGGTSLSADETAGIDQDVKAMATGTDANGNPVTGYSMHMAVMHVLDNFRAQGVTDPVKLDAASRFVQQRWAEYKGWQPVSAPTPNAPSAPSNGLLNPLPPDPTQQTVPMAGASWGTGG